MSNLPVQETQCEQDLAATNTTVQRAREAVRVVTEMTFREMELLALQRYEEKRHEIMQVRVNLQPFIEAREFSLAQKTKFYVRETAKALCFE